MMGGFVEVNIHVLLTIYVLKLPKQCTIEFSLWLARTSCSAVAAV